jgi:hypothetical protein
MPTKDLTKVAGFLYLVKMQIGTGVGLGVIEGPYLTESEVRIVEAFLERLRAEEADAEIQKLKP